MFTTVPGLDAVVNLPTKIQECVTRGVSSGDSSQADAQSRSSGNGTDEKKVRFSYDMSPLTKHVKIPVLIIPGFMSSGLTIEKSSLDPSWEGKRLWLNLSSLGFHSLHVGGALRKNEEMRSFRVAHPSDIENVQESVPIGAEGRTSDELHQEYLKQVNCKSKWVQHMILKPDMIHEKSGVKVRPIEGTAGVDYLAEGKLTESVSYVFGPVLKLLKSVGYVEGEDLDAAPYDWRIPPNELQLRDEYFTETMKKIEDLYKKSNNSPVLILCHSMGSKTAHYLFNFVLSHLGEEDGQRWLNSHIHSYVPVGAPHVGAPKAFRATIGGDKMGLDAFLSNDEGIMLGRSFGSGPWLYPLSATKEEDNLTRQPLSQSPGDEQAPPKPSLSSPVIIRNESSLHITIPSQYIIIHSYIHFRVEPPLKLRLAIDVGKNLTLHTSYIKVNPATMRRKPFLTLDHDEFVIACPTSLEESLQLFPYIRVRIEEPGAGTPPKQKKGICHVDILWPLRCFRCLVKWVFCLVCAVICKVGCLLTTSAKRAASAGAAVLGATRVIGESKKIDWKQYFLAFSPGRSGGVNNDVEGSQSLSYDMKVLVEPIDKVRIGFFLNKPSPKQILLNIRWEPPKLKSDNNHISNHLVVKDAGVFHQQKKNVSYQHHCLDELLGMEGLTQVQKLLKDDYGNDPLGPLSLSSSCPPPVKRVIAIYGINLPTEVGAIYRRSDCVKLSSASNPDHVPQMFVLDEEASLRGELAVLYVNDGGLIRETPKEIASPSMRNSEVTRLKSGDGVVPYWSLEHCQKWQGKGAAKCEVEVHEIESAEHRAILNDKRFHKVLLDLLGVG